MPQTLHRQLNNNNMMHPLNVMENLYNALCHRVYDYSTIRAEMDQFATFQDQAFKVLKVSIHDPLEYLYSHMVHIHSIYSVMPIAQHYITCVFRAAMYSRFYTRRGRIVALPTDEQLHSNLDYMLTLLRDTFHDNNMSQGFDEVMYKILHVFTWLLNQERCHMCLPFIPTFTGLTFPTPEEYFDSYQQPTDATASSRPVTPFTEQHQLQVPSNAEDATIHTENE